MSERDADERDLTTSASRVELVAAAAARDDPPPLSPRAAKYATRGRLPVPSRLELESDLGALHWLLLLVGVVPPRAGRSACSRLFHWVYASLVFLVLCFRCFRLAAQDELHIRTYALVFLAPIITFVVSLEMLGRRGMLAHSVRGHARMVEALTLRPLSADEAAAQQHALRRMVRSKSRLFTAVCGFLVCVQWLAWNVQRILWIVDPGDDESLPSRGDDANAVDERLSGWVGRRTVAVFYVVTDLHLFGVLFAVAAILLCVYMVDAQQRLVLSYLDKDEQRRSDQFSVPEVGVDVSLLPEDDDDMPPRALLRAHRLTRGVWASILRYERRIVLLVVPALVICFAGLSAELYLSRGARPEEALFLSPLIVVLGVAVAVEYEMQLRRTSSRIMLNFRDMTGHRPEDVLEDGAGPLAPFAGGGGGGGYERERPTLRTESEKPSLAPSSRPRSDSGDESSDLDSGSDGERHDEDEFQEFRRRAYTGRFAITAGEQESGGVDRFSYVAPATSFDDIVAQTVPMAVYSFGVALVLVGVMTMRAALQFPGCETTVSLRSEGTLVIEEDATACSSTTREVMDAETSFHAQPVLWLSTLWLVGVLFGPHTVTRNRARLLYPVLLVVAGGAAGIYAFTGQDDGPAWQFTAISSAVTVAIMVYLIAQLSWMTRSWRLARLLLANCLILLATVVSLKFIVLSFLESEDNDERFSVVVVALPLLEFTLTGAAEELAERLYELRFSRELEDRGGHPVDRVQNSWIILAVPEIFFKLVGRLLVFALDSFSSQAVSVVVLLIVEVLARVTAATRVGIAHHLARCGRRPAKAMERLEHRRTHPVTAHHIYVGMLVEIAAVFAAFGVTLVLRAIYGLELGFNELFASLAFQLFMESLADVGSVFLEESALDIYLLGFWKRANQSMYYIVPTTYFFYVVNTSLGLEMSAIVRYAGDNERAF